MSTTGFESGGWGLRRKFILFALMLTAGIIAIVFIAQAWVVRGKMVEQTTEQGASIADTIVSTSGYYVTFGLVDDLQAILEDVAKNPTVEYADFVSSDGTRSCLLLQGHLRI